MRLISLPTTVLRAVAGCLLITCLDCPAWGAELNPVSAGQLAFDGGDYTRARALWLEASQSGDVEARFRLGVLFDRGLTSGTPDYDQAFHWYEQAALQGHPEAGYNLGNAYKNGRGATRSDSLANYW